MENINFFTSALGKHNIYAFPYIVSSLITNDDAVCEIIVESTNVLSSTQKDFLTCVFKNNWLIHTPDSPMDKWNRTNIAKLASVRWISIPKIKCPYTYTGDVDILLLDKDIYHEHLEHARFLELPYSNIIRHPNKRFSGCHFVISDDWYSKINSDYCKEVVQKIETTGYCLDEWLLYKLALNFGLPDEEKLKTKSNSGILPYYNVFYRPIHGIHLSLNRKDLLGWGVSLLRYQQFLNFKQNIVWKEAEKLFDEKYMELYNLIPLAYEKNRLYMEQKRRKT